MELYGGETMKLKQTFLAAIISLLAFVLPASAQTIGAARAVTCNGPYGILISLGIENTGLTDAQVYWFYNIISIGVIMLVAAMASERNMRHWNIIIPIVAAMMVFFGWMNSPNPSNTWGIIVGVAMLAGMIYMKDALHEKFGTGGPGTPLMTLAAYLIIFQCIVGICNSTTVGFGGNNVGATPSSYQAGSIDVSEQFGSSMNTGGLLDSVLSAGSLLLTIGIGALSALVAVIQAVVLFSATLTDAYPFLLDSPFAILLLGAFQVAEWILIVKLAYDMFYTKNVFVDI